MATSTPAINEPFPIFKLAHRYILYDAATITCIRKKYNICGVLIGSLPQAPQQNVFLGLPLELMPEEARLLVEKGVAYIADDAKAHRRGYLEGGLNPDERRAFQAALRRQGVGAVKETNRKQDEKKKAVFKRKAGTEGWNDVPDDMLKPAAQQKKEYGDVDPVSTQNTIIPDEDDSIFDTPSPSTKSSISKDSRPDPVPWAITPTTSYPPLHSDNPSSDDLSNLPDVPQSYPVFQHLHERDYFLSPGLRFGCQYMAYPGDPLRFHSHFLCNGMDWDQEFDLLDLVAGGRLGTGVKKGFLIGGREEGGSEEDAEDDVRVFCVEWAGM